MLIATSQACVFGAHLTRSVKVRSNTGPLRTCCTEVCLGLHECYDVRLSFRTRIIDPSYSATGACFEVCGSSVDDGYWEYECVASVDQTSFREERNQITTVRAESTLCLLASRNKSLETYPSSSLRL